MLATPGSSAIGTGIQLSGRISAPADGRPASRDKVSALMHIHAQLFLTMRLHKVVVAEVEQPTCAEQSCQAGGRS